MKVLVTGAAGFIGKNLTVRLHEIGIEVLAFRRGDSDEKLGQAVRMADAVVHLAGENRPASPDAFEEVNVGLTRSLCAAISASGRVVPLLFTSSYQAEIDNPYGRSKLEAEKAVSALAGNDEIPAAIYRLPGVFGKWCRPNYNSVVATFCSNIANGLPIRIDDPSKSLRLVYIDDVITSFIGWIQDPGQGLRRRSVSPEYGVTLKDLASQIEEFRRGRLTLQVGSVGSGFARALYATFISYLPTEEFSYQVPVHKDERGVFVEMLKTPNAGQFSFLTAHPGVIRGGHYHHTKTEKFLVLKGKARFGFRHIITGEEFDLETNGEELRVVDTIPGWAHDIENIGEDELIVMLWANEQFDRDRPDTVPRKV